MIPAYLAPLADHLWQSTLFAAAAGLLVLGLRQNRAAVRYKLWLAASIKFLIPFSLLVSVGSQVQWRSVAPVAAPSLSFAMTEISQPFALPVTIPAIPAPVEKPERLPMVLFCIWLVGAVVSLAPWFSQWRRIRRTLRTAKPLQWDLPIRVVSCAGNVEPGVFGIFRPVLLLPDGIADRLTPSELQALLSHELCHVRRRDNLSAMVHMVVEFLFWFHPLVWWIENRLTEEQENACDEEVLRLGSDPQVYAEGILKVCRLYLASPLACVAKVTGSDLRKRVEAIMKDGAALKLNLAKKFLLATAGMVVVAGPIVVGLVNAPPTRAQSAVAEGRHAAFDVVSIKPCEDPRQHQVPGGMYPPRGNSSPGRLSTDCFPLLDNVGFGLIRGAYASDPFTPITGGPSWIHSAFYAVNATAEGNPSVAVMRGPMMQGLLEDHFQLKIHHQMSEGPVYFLSVARGGPKLHSFIEGSCTLRSTSPPPALQPGQKYCERTISAGLSPSVEAQGATLDEFSELLLPVLARPVINETGITGRFDIRVEFSREGTNIVMPYVVAGTAPATPSDPTDHPSIFTVLQEELGLKLESGKGPVEMFVIDHIERPKENEAVHVSEEPSVKDATSAFPVSKTASVPQTKSTGILSLISGKATQSPSLTDVIMTFEAATVKPSSGGSMNSDGSISTGGSCRGIDTEPPKYEGVNPALGRCRFVAIPIKPVISYAYGLGGFTNNSQQKIIGGPSWIDTEEFTIEAEAADPEHTTAKQLISMLRPLLEDRFKLTYHRETKESSALALIVGKNGPKLKASKDPQAQVLMRRAPGVAASSNATMWILADFLSRELGRPVVDETGLKGYYQVDLRWVPDTTAVPSASASNPSSASPVGPSLLQVLDDFGLRLEPRKISNEVFVIDHIEKPIEK